jgi:hypothetical protein
MMKENRKMKNLFTDKRAEWLAVKNLFPCLTHWARAARLVLMLVGVIWGIQAAPAALAQGVPGGSYQQSCKKYDLAFGHMLFGVCQEKSGKEVSARLRFSFLCSGDISNNNGKLTCTKSSQSPQFKAAVSAFTSASVAVLGRLPKSVGIEETDNSASEMLSWLSLMHSMNMGQQYQEGTRFSDAVAVLKQLLTNQPPIRGEVVKQAYLDVYGSNPEPAQYDYWCKQLGTKTDWYATLVAKLNAELNANKGPFSRKTIIHTVYVLVFGREASESDLKYWLPRTENYSQMLLANRNWLYSDNGKGDLYAAVKLAFLVKMKKNNPSDTEIWDTAKLFTPKKLIYIEMVK